MEDKYLYMIRQAQEFMNENHYADISRLHCLLRKMMPKEYHDLIGQIKECQDPHVSKQSLRAVLRTLIKMYTFAPNFKFGTK